jgi:putative tryptophan/tyrosine transport system substrate-binding protein
MKARCSLVLAVALALGGSAMPLAAEAQSTAKARRIGFLGSASPGAYSYLVDALRQGLVDLGYVEGKNLTIEYRWAESKYERLPGLAAELVRLNVDLIVTHGTPGSLAAKQATATIPIVMAISGDAVATGLVASIARPGGNVTGSTFFFPELNAKRVELLKAAVPRISRMVALTNPDNPSHAPALRAMAEMARALNVELQTAEARGPEDLPGTFADLARRRVEAVAVLDDPMLITNARQIAELAVKHRLPTIGFREYAEAGGLMSYAVNFPEIWRRAAVFIDKIFKGAKPGELPIEQATRFELVLNARTIKALGLTIPQAVLLRADQIVE